MGGCGLGAGMGRAGPGKAAFQAPRGPDMQYMQQQQQQMLQQQQQMQMQMHEWAQMPGAAAAAAAYAGQFQDQQHRDQYRHQDQQQMQQHFVQHPGYALAMGMHPASMGQGQIPAADANELAMLHQQLAALSFGRQQVSADGMGNRDSKQAACARQSRDVSAGPQN